MLSQEKIHIAIISETWLEPDSSLRISGYNIFREDRDDGYGGISIIAHHSVKCLRQPVLINNSNIQAIHLQLLNCEHLNNILAIYCTSEARTSQRDWDQIFSLFNNKTIIAGDFNAHHISWSYKTDTRGRRIFDSLLDNNCITLNDGSPTRIKLVEGRLQSTSPDVTIVSSDIALRFGWKVTNENLGSDHLVIKFTTELSGPTMFRKKRNFKEADWQSYSSHIDNRITSTNIPLDPQEAYDQFIDTLNRAAEESIPYIKICDNPQRLQRFKPKPYWNQELSKSVAERRLALTIFRKNPTPDNLQVLNEKTASAQKYIRNAKIKSWQSFCDSIEGVTTSGEMWRRMKWLKGYRSPQSYIDKDRAINLLSKLTPDYVTPCKPSFKSTNTQLSMPISAQELERSIKPKDTAPGTDLISFSMIKKLPTSGKQRLLSLYNWFLSSGFVPKQWRNVKIVPVPKSGSTSSSPEFRPIALISCICKIFHAVINHRLEWYLEKQSLFPRDMVGFRKSRSCLDSLTKLVTDIQIGFTRKQITLGCFIDIENAYNNIDVGILLNSLDDLGIGSKICSYLWNFLSLRYLGIQSVDSETHRSTGRGLAQGDPLSPLLFNAATIAVTQSISNNNVSMSQYADDFVLYHLNSDPLKATNNIQKALDTFVKSINNLGLEISTKKTKFCLFSRRYRNVSISLNSNGSPLKRADNIKYLGVWLDRSLLWGKHVNETCQKTIKFVNTLKALAGSSWGVHPKHCRRLYLSLIRSRLDYASFLYDCAAICHLSKLDRVQNQSMRVIGGFIKSTPIHVMESELSLQPLHVRRHYLAGKFYLKLKSLANNEINDKISELSYLCSGRYWARKRKPLLSSTHEYFKDIPIYCSKVLEMYCMDIWVGNIDLSSCIYSKIEGVEKAKRALSSSYLKQKS